LSNAVQEHAVVGDLLQCLQGNQGVYIKPLPLTSRFGTRSFSVDESMAPTLLDTVNKILPICSDYSTIVRFVGEKSTFEHGVVNHALAGAIRRLIKDYLVLLCQLEHQYRIGQLGIARLQFFLRDSATIFTQLSRVVMDITRGNCLGGAVLSLLYDHARTVYGVKQMNELLSYLLRAASVPFFTILQKWIYRGVISDPYEEFFIATGPVPEFLQPGRHLNPRDQNQWDQVAHEYVDWAFFWERHYSVIPTNLPSFLASHLNKILNTGKYLNVVQQCANVTDAASMESAIKELYVELESRLRMREKLINGERREAFHCLIALLPVVPYTLNFYLFVEFSLVFSQHGEALLVVVIAVAVVFLVSSKHMSFCPIMTFLSLCHYRFFYPYHTADAYELPQIESIEYEESEMKYLEQIENAHLYASSLLLRLMMHEKDLKEHLKSIKRYFLLDQADFIVHFMDAAAKELCKPSTGTCRSFCFRHD
uniref:Gamma-tubulin complex component n=1 Tax=Echinostoma caproni TaxID=27848 RepID=A0A183AN02_9TREM